MTRWAKAIILIMVVILAAYFVLTGIADQAPPPAAPATPALSD